VLSGSSLILALLIDDNVDNDDNDDDDVDDVDDDNGMIVIIQLQNF